MTKGDSITITDQADGHKFDGVVKFANDDFLTVDLGCGCVVLVRRDANLNSWKVGTHPVTIGPKDFGSKMQKVYDLAEEKFGGRDYDQAEWDPTYSE